jgi:hypothetical protein
LFRAPLSLFRAPLSLFRAPLSLFRLLLSLFELLPPLLGGLGGGSLRGTGGGSFLGLSARGVSERGVSARGISGFRSSCAHTIAGRQKLNANAADATNVNFILLWFISASVVGTKLIVSRESQNPDECLNYTLLKLARNI